MPQLTEKSTVVAEAIKNILIANKSDLGVDVVYYGFQNKIPSGLGIIIEPQEKERELSGVAGPGGRAMNTMRFIIWVHNSIVGNEEDERFRVDRLAEDVETLVHQDTTLGGIIIHGYFEQMTAIPDFQLDSQYRSVRMNYKAITKTNITVV